MKSWAIKMKKTKQKTKIWFLLWSMMGKEFLRTKLIWFSCCVLLPISPHKQYNMFYGTYLFQIGFSWTTLTALFSDLEFIFLCRFSCCLKPRKHKCKHPRAKWFFWLRVVCFQLPQMSFILINNVNCRS